jgi:hypothetical protein
MDRGVLSWAVLVADVRGRRSWPDSTTPEGRKTAEDSSTSPASRSTLYLRVFCVNEPIQVPNDNYVNPGANYYFLANPSEPFNAVTTP